MAKFNVVQKQRRAIKQQQKRIIHGDPISAKIKIKPQPINISGKRKRKLFKKALRDEKEALTMTKGLTMQDVEMAAAEGSSSREPAKFHMKKKLKLKLMKGKGKNKRKALKRVAVASVEAMAE